MCLAAGTAHYGNGQRSRLKSHDSALNLRAMCGERTLEIENIFVGNLLIERKGLQRKPLHLRSDAGWQRGADELLDRSTECIFDFCSEMMGVGVNGGLPDVPEHRLSPQRPKT